MLLQDPCHTYKEDDGEGDIENGACFADELGTEVVHALSDGGLLPHVNRLPPQG